MPGCAAGKASIEVVDLVQFLVSKYVVHIAITQVASDLADSVSPVTESRCFPIARSHFGRVCSLKIKCAAQTFTSRLD
jgi:hypothetical protein